MDLNWNCCIICQKDTSEQLSCPMRSPGAVADKTDAYTSFLTNLEQFREIDLLPTDIYFASHISTADLVSHCASWHESCRLKYDYSELTKARKRKWDDTDEHGKISSKRQSLDIVNGIPFVHGHVNGDAIVIPSVNGCMNRDANGIPVNGLVNRNANGIPVNGHVNGDTNGIPVNGHVNGDANGVPVNGHVNGDHQIQTFAADETMWGWTCGPGHPACF